MQNSFPKALAINEPVLSYHPGSEINAVQQAYKTLYHQNTEVPLTLDSKKSKHPIKGYDHRMITNTY